MDIKVEESVQKFVHGLEKPTISKFSKLVDLLEQFGSQLPMPYSRKVSNKLFELRIRGQQEARIFYTFYQGRIILFHGFIKKTQKIPRKEIETALKKLGALTAT